MKILIYYLIIINIITFIAFGIDKQRAIKDGRRIRNKVLLGLSLIGGSIGGILAMRIFRHKTKTSYYVISLPIMLVVQVAIIVIFISKN